MSICCAVNFTRKSAFSFLKNQLACVVLMSVPHLTRHAPRVDRIQRLTHSVITGCVTQRVVQLGLTIQTRRLAIHG